MFRGPFFRTSTRGSDVSDSPLRKLFTRCRSDVFHRHHLSCQFRDSKIAKVREAFMPPRTSMIFHEDTVSFRSDSISGNQGKGSLQEDDYQPPLACGPKPTLPMQRQVLPRLNLLLPENGCPVILKLKPEGQSHLNGYTHNAHRMQQSI